MSERRVSENDVIVLTHRSELLAEQVHARQEEVRRVRREGTKEEKRLELLATLASFSLDIDYGIPASVLIEADIEIVPVGFGREAALFMHPTGGSGVVIFYEDVIISGSVIKPGLGHEASSQ